MSDFIPLTPVQYDIFIAIKNAESDIGYTELCELTEYKRVNLTSHVSRLIKREILHPTGNHKNRKFCLNVDPEKVILVDKIPRENSEENEPEEAVEITIRGCITCKEPMKSTDPGHRICGHCKKSNKYKNYGNRYAPDGEAEVSNFSEISVGYFQ